MKTGVQKTGVQKTVEQGGGAGCGLLRSGLCRIHVTLPRKLCSLREAPEAGEKKGFELRRIKPGLST